MISFEKIFDDMAAEYQSLTKSALLKNSESYIKLKILASQIFSLQTKLDWVKKQVFPQTSSGKYLDYHAQTRGLTRKNATCSFGILTFSISTPSSADLTIPAKTLCFCSPELKFETTCDGVIKQGELSIDIPAKSVSAGLNTNTGPNTINKIINPPTAIDSVTNLKAFYGGQDDEPDEKLRTRILDNFKNISNGCNPAYYYNLAMAYDEITSANVLPRNRGRGTVDIIVATNTPGVIKTIEANIQEKKEINVDVKVIQAKPKKIKITLDLVIHENYIFNNVTQKIHEVIKTFISKLKVAQPLNIAALGAEIFSCPEVANYKFSTPLTDVYINKDEIITLDDVVISKQN